MKNVLPYIVGQAIRAENDARRLARRRQDAIMRGVPLATVELLYGAPGDAISKAALNLRDIEQGQRAAMGEEAKP